MHSNKYEGKNNLGKIKANLINVFVCMLSFMKLFTPLALAIDPDEPRVEHTIESVRWLTENPQYLSFLDVATSKDVEGNTPLMFAILNAPDAAPTLIEHADWM